MKRLLLLPVALFWITISAQEKLIQYNDFYLKNIKIEELPTNSKLSDFGPCLVDGKLFFTSLNEPTNTTSSKEKTQSFYQLFTVNINKTGHVLSNRRPVDSLSSSYNLGAISYDKNHKELIVTRNNIDEPFVYSFKPIQKKAYNLEMAIAKYSAGQWKFTGEFDHNNIEYSIGQPAYTPSGDTLIFVSDMPGGFGETDLYMSIRLSDGWTYPRNLGARINTPNKEFSPFVTENGILIFASNGLEEDKDLDLYFTLLDEVMDPTIVKFPVPINSEFDDFGMSVLQDHSFGYFTTNRPGTGSDDIYRIDFNLQFAKLRGKVVNKSTGLPINQAVIEFSPEVVNPQLTYTDAEGIFRVSMTGETVSKVIASKEGYVSETIIVGTNDSIFIQLQPDLKIVLAVTDVETNQYLTGVEIDINGSDKFVTESGSSVPIPLESGKTYSITATKPGYLENTITIKPTGDPVIDTTLRLFKSESGKSYQLQNIAFVNGKYDILTSTAMELDALITLLDKNREINMEVYCIPNQGDNYEYNTSLADKRSAAIAKYLNSNGSIPNRVIAKTFNEDNTPANFKDFDTTNPLLQNTVVTIVDGTLNNENINPKTENKPVVVSNNTKPFVTSKTEIKPSSNMPAVNVAGKNFRVQFYASKKPININTSMKEIVEKFSQYGLINCEEDFLIKYQIGPFNNQDDAASVYTKIRNLGYQVMMLEYESNTKIKMLLPN